MNDRPYLCLLTTLLLFCSHPVSAQQTDKLPFLVPADSLNKTRFWTCLGGGAALYGATSVALYNTWYKDFELTGFHTFDDSGEWLQMDKAGHLFTTYTESRISYKGARWTGIPDRKARWIGIGVGMLLQSTVEVMDGFSAKWGFSWYDMAYNALGAGIFMGQEALWSEQRLVIKVSNTPPDYPTMRIAAQQGEATSSPARRAADLYGVSFAETFLKDYNGLTIWASVNPVAFLAEDRRNTWWPRWLNIAVGYSGENLYGGFENTWEDEAGKTFSLSPETFPRYRQFYLSLDVDVDRIRTRSPLIRTLLTVVSWIKVPAPALEVNTLGGIRFHPFFW